MDIKELRIGNYYIWKSEGKDYVYQVKPMDFMGENYKNFYPIPLTEEWLLKFGFSDKEYKHGFIGKDYKSGNMTLSFVLDKPFYKGEWNKFYTYDLRDHIFVNIEHVHQLQNLYFALTGKELQLFDKYIV